MVAKTVSDIGERGLIHIISELLGGLGNDILTGEDDAVAIKLKDPSTLVINTDMLVSTTDVPPQMTLFQAARKAVVMTVSDILVKGANPKWAVVALGISGNLPVEGDRGFKGLISGLKAGFLEYGVQYLGGDLNETKETVISCTVFGDAPNGVIPRSGAKPGDLLICTGEMGKTGCGFSILVNNKEPNDLEEDQRKQFIDTILIPKTPINHSRILLENNWVTASCDSSDGILATIREICKSSNVGAILEWNSLPIAKGVIEFCQNTNQNPIDLVFNAGEEFFHIFTIPKIKLSAIQEHFKKNVLSFYVIGKITEQKKILLRTEDTEINLDEQTGYEHFRKKREN
ncbi:MAG: thiamine-phosphate kinase [Promethearchaeota archaeon]|nr:MAG: thiamine-phosphate kinase [Candidatus Lokiarchaeota archaeon]